MKIAIAGGSGMIGNELMKRFKKDHHSLIVLTRNPSTDRDADGVRYVKWLDDNSEEVAHELEGVDAIINLAGRSINDGRWTKEERRSIYTSRINASNELVRIVDQMKKAPKVIVQASAIGVYHTSKTKEYHEGSSTEGREFLQIVVRGWERALEPLQQKTRVVYARLGVVLHPTEGAFPLMKLPYQLFAGGTIASGEQWVSWVHIDDVVGAFDTMLKDEALFGPVNVTAPYPVRMKQFGKAIGHALHRPHYFPVPKPLLEIVLGRKNEIITKGQCAKPRVLQRAQFHFNYPTIDSALRQLTK